MMNASRPILLIRLSSEIPILLTKYTLQQYSNSNMSAKYKNYIGYTTLSRSNIQHLFSCPLSTGIFNRLNYKRLQMWSIDFKHTLYVGVLVWGLMLKWNPCIIDVCCCECKSSMIMTLHVLAKAFLKTWHQRWLIFCSYFLLNVRLQFKTKC